MRFTENAISDQTGTTVFITGANTGIGFEAARVLASKGARVLLGCRSETKANEAMARITALCSNADVKWVPLDLTNLDSVNAAAKIVNQEPRLDTLINNAGVMIPPKTLTRDGFELQFGVNHLGHFALTGHLLEKLQATTGSRVVNVSSLAHVQGRIDFDDPNAENNYNAMSRYRTSKVANMYFTFEMSKRCEQQGISILNVACHPGIANTELSRYLPKWFWLLAPLIRPLMNSPAEGALPTLMAATQPGINPKDYFGPTKRGETARSASIGKIASHVFDESIAEKLWDMSQRMTGVSYL